MKRAYWIVLVLLFVACTSNSAVPEPTTTDSVTAEPTATQVQLPTRQPLPPTWTPAAVATVTPFPTQTFIPQTAAPTRTLAAECQEFAADYERSSESIRFGESPIIFWTSIGGAANYRVTLTDEEGTPIWVQLLEPTTDSYTFPPEVFDLTEEHVRLAQFVVFGWEVVPVDARRTPFCSPVAGEFVILPAEANAE